jgi:hypothetical protein
MNNYTELNGSRKMIEKLSKFHQIEVLKILKKNNIILNENNYGTFINMSELSENVLTQIYEYIDYTKEQEIQLINRENEKSILKNKFFKNEKINIASAENNI